MHFKPCFNIRIKRLNSFFHLQIFSPPFIIYNIEKMKLFMPTIIYVFTENYLFVYRFVDILFMHTGSGTEIVSSSTNVELAS